MRRRELQECGRCQTNIVSSNLLLKCMILTGPLPEQGLLPHLPDMLLPVFRDPTHQGRGAASIVKMFLL
jgi:hypothetical protein